MLELKKITKIYETETITQKALNNVSISFRENEFVSILGPSGSGKTTLLNIIGGLDDYTSGDLIINGKSTKEYTDRDWDTYRNHSIGFVFQSYNLIPHQSVISNVELALTLSGVSKNERRKKAEKTLKKVGLEEHMFKHPNQLSGGQMQRVAIARALVNDPDILLADEPTGALDSKTSTQIMELLKEVAKDKLVIMVTHNADLAKTYSTRIIELKDGVIKSDSKQFDGKDKKDLSKSKTKKTSMSYLTALSLSLNNLMTKKGRTILTAFAGSIGIIGIALIMSLSNGIQEYINKTEEETLSSYPLLTEKEYNDDKIHSVNIMGDMLTTFTNKAQINDLKNFKKFLENDESNIKDYLSAVKYGYGTTLNLYKNDLENVTQVNPTTIFSALGMNFSTASVYDSYMSNYDVFYELIDNDTLNHQQYDLVAGSWPKKYNEMVLVVDKNNQVTDYTLYSLGILDQNDLKEQFSNMVSGKEVNFTETSYDVNDIIGLSFRLVLNTDYYKKSNGIWISMEDNTDYMKEVLKNSEEIKIVGIIKPNEEAIVSSTRGGMVAYTHDLMTHLIERINETEIVKEQKENPTINIFTGKDFSTKTFDMSSLTYEEKMLLSSMSQSEIVEYYKTITENLTSTYKENLDKLGVASLDDPKTISLYPKDFNSKEEITKIIDDYNKGKDEKDQIKYTDLVGIMMSSVSTIVNVISSVLIAFVAISLVVSSIMIAIITYISVIERTKEIGILRAIGASKNDISRVFNAETLIEGLTAGVLGILVTILLNIPINIIIKDKVNISNISVLPVDGAIILILISIFLTVIAGFIPAKIASKKDPVEALRTE